jgi:AbrB family looped-hinge helix DNA binding protein
MLHGGLPQLLYIHTVVVKAKLGKRQLEPESGKSGAQTQVMQICITMIVSTNEVNMSTLTVTARGQVTIRKEVLQHLGIQPGEKIELYLLPDGRA